VRDALARLLLDRQPVADAAAALRAGRGRGGLAVGRPAWPAVIAALSDPEGPAVLAVAGGDEEARDLAGDLAALAGDRVALWPSRGVPAGEGLGPAPHLVGQRARARAALARPGAIVVASVAALVERLAREDSAPLELVAGEAVEGEVLERLAGLGYERVPQVEERGEVSSRGGIVDVFGSTADLPVRLDMFGDEVEEIRAFSPFTQVTVRRLQRATVWPAAEPRQGRLVEALEVVEDSGARVVRLAPAEHPPALARALELVEEEVAAGMVGEADPLLAGLERAARLDLAPPAGGAAAFDAQEARFATRGVTEAAAELDRLARSGMRVVVAFTRRGELERAAAQLERVHPRIVEAGDPLPRPGVVGLTRLPIRSGFVSRDLGLALVPDGQVLRRRRAPARRVPAGRRLSSLLELRPGDHVVHEDHGIGRLIGFETREVAAVTRDYLALAFAGEDRVWVPSDQLEKITRYIGADGTAPPLSRLGGRAWDRLKARARAAVQEMAGELFALYEARGRATGVPFPAHEAEMAELERGFPYRETPDQERAIDEVVTDMERPRPMDRLICGDVGFGKTEVAIRAAYKAVLGGKQVMVLVPTTLLAQQHLGTFRERFVHLAVTVDMVSRLRSAQEQRQALDAFAAGRLDILIGTHRLLGMDVEPKDLGLVVVDEEQRFGVAQKEALRRLRLKVDVLALSATPIPRTLQMSLSGIRDISVMETPPPGRRAIATHVGEMDDAVVREALEREAARGGQSFWLHNRVETIDEAAERVRELVPGLRVLVAHGQMGESDLEEAMLAFLRGEGDILVSTTIIEAGLDIPNANTLVVERADLLGLAQLYQIRGRVGRSAVTAHAYLLYPDAAALTREAAARLRAVADYTELGSGLRIAMRDLEIRGAGNLLGDEQSGHVAAIGFELYVQMLHDAIAARRGEAVPEREARIELPVSAYIPTEYVAFEAAKVDLHRRIAMSDDEEALARLRAEVEDRFGAPPPPVEALVALQRLRLKLERLGAQRLAVRQGRMVVAPVSLTSAAIRSLREAEARAVYSSAERTVSAPAPSGPAGRLETAERVLDALLGAVALAA
jgi:transcription-repair coupling factor (superfamily II helicase)